MVLTLISATPSPFARINRIALAEKGIPFELKTEIPWHPDTQTPTFNPLEKLPILFDSSDPSFEPVYDSAHIQEYIIQKFSDKSPSLLTGNLDLDLKARQLQVLAEGVMDAFVLEFFEIKREGGPSQSWLDRQRRKTDGGLKAMEELVKNRKGEYLVGDGSVLTIADIAVVCGATQIDFGGIRPGWRETHPNLAKWLDQMNEKKNFKDTMPVMFDLKAGVV